MQNIKIRLVFKNTTLTATLNDSAAAHDFAAMLPLTLTLTDYAQTEKISDLPGKLSTTDAPEGSNPVAGSIAYYAPWGNLAIFHRDFRYSPSLVILGQIDGDIRVLQTHGEITTTIEVAK